MIKTLELKGGLKYYFQTNFFLGSVLILLGIAVFFFISLGADPSQHIYIKCPDKSVMPCENPLYNNYAYCGKILAYTDPICNKETLSIGESYGEAPPKIINGFPVFTVMLLTFAFILNHFFYNKGFKFKKAIDEGFKNE